MSALESLLETWEQQYAEGEARFCPQAIDEVRAAFFTYERGLAVIRENAQTQLLAKIEALRLRVERHRRTRRPAPQSARDG